MTRLLVLLTALAVPSSSVADSPDPAVLLELARAKRTREAALVKPAAVRTTCDCGDTGKCRCYVGECSCSACGLGGAAKQAGKLSGSGTIPTTPAPRADGLLQPGLGLGSSAGTSQEGMSTGATAAGPSGITSGCPNGQCPSGRMTYSRGLIFRRW